jgi:hypothetical protein
VISGIRGVFLRLYHPKDWQVLDDPWFESMRLDHSGGSAKAVF